MQNIKKEQALGFKRPEKAQRNKAMTEKQHINTYMMMEC